MVNVPLKHTEVEGECFVKQAYAVRRHLSLIVVVGAISMFFLFIPLLFLIWYPRLRRFLFYSDCRIQRATHVWIINMDDEQDSVCLERGVVALTFDMYLDTYYFKNRYMKYYYNQEMFQAVEYQYGPQLSQIQNTSLQGLTAAQFDSHFATYGQGLAHFQLKTWYSFAYLQCTKPYFIFIIFCFIDMCFTDYLAFGLVILGFSLVTLVMTISEYMEFETQLAAMTFQETNYQVLRDGKIIKCSNRFIVPGDIIFVKENMIPFDGIIVSGTLLINQSSLTGQSYPVSKKQISFHEYKLGGKIPEQSTVYEGTKIVQSYNNNTKYRQNGVALLVTHTSFSSYKGQILRIIKYPKNALLQFENEAYWFVFGIVRTHSFRHKKIQLFVQLIIVAVADTCIHVIFTNDPNLRASYMRRMLLGITIAVPPQLPTVMNVAALQSMKRLKVAGIATNNNAKIIENGKINMVCFDKTGTLTRKDVQLEGVLPRSSIEAQTQMFTKANRGDLIKMETQSQEIQTIFKLFASCHSLSLIKQINAVDGDPIEVELFRFGAYQLDNQYSDARFPGALGRVTKLEPGSKPLDLLIVRRFEFTPQQKKMSTVVFDNRAGKTYIFTKGSPQALSAISSQQTLLFSQTLNKYTQKGLRVLSIAYKQISSQSINTISRSQAESGLSFLGFTIFENKLKEQSPDVVATLRKNGFRCVMLTGDNKETAMAIAAKLHLDPNEVKARCTPEQKATFIQEFKSQGYKVMMCGDGFNDLLALKTAHIGYGVDGGWGMDFVGQIGGVLSILEEGRAAIVCGISVVKIIVTYAMTQFVAQTFASLVHCDVSNTSYIYHDMLLDIIPIMLIPLAKPKPLTYDRPYTSILNLPTILSIGVCVAASIILSQLFANKPIYMQLNDAMNQFISDSEGVEQLGNRDSEAGSLLFYIMAGVTVSSVLSMDWKYTWRKEDCRCIAYILVMWAIVHLVPHVGWMRTLFSMDGDQDAGLMFRLVLVMDVCIPILILIQRFLIYPLSRWTAAREEEASRPRLPAEDKINT